MLDVLVVAAYGLILPPAILAWPRHGCVNVHASLLPRWRGAAPIQRALLAGDAETGITLMQMDAGLDTGPMLDVVRVPIDARETAGTLEHKLALAGASALVVVSAPVSREATLGAADAATGGRARRMRRRFDKSEADIDWSASAATIDRQVRAFDPAPGRGDALVGRAGQGVARASRRRARRAADAPGPCSPSIDDGIIVACGEGALVLAELQPAGGRRMSAAHVRGRAQARSPADDSAPRERRIASRPR